MSEITLRKIVDDIDILRSPPYTYVLLEGGGITGNGASAASNVMLGYMPYIKWRVINVGFTVLNGGASTIAETLSFGLQASDAGALDVDLFGTFAQDVTAGEQVTAGDCYQRANIAYYTIPDAPAVAATPVWSAGTPDGFNQWFTRPGYISATKNNVASSTFTAMPWVLIEIDQGV